ncbi:MAG: L-histidine N(alpha)-methyltransferase [Saprospiraceae bacterium]
MPSSLPTSSLAQSDFAKHVAEGLSTPLAHLSSRFIYDEQGSKLFQQIMGLDSYYLTNCEYEILEDSASSLRQRFSGPENQRFELVELGAGDGLKTKLLLKDFVANATDFSYRPLDISADILSELKSALDQQFPSLEVAPLHASYMEALDELHSSPTVRKVVLFLGSNIGNFSLEGAKKFVGQISQRMQVGDYFLLGIDLRKNPRTILAAYDDEHGVTAKFNLNLLVRINRELGGNFDLNAWDFHPLYNPETGEVRSYLYPKTQQHVSIPLLNIERTFNTGEVIHTEVSRKYSRAELDQLGSSYGLERVDMLHDKRGYFADVVYQKK